jgi:hypothetical protein
VRFFRTCLIGLAPVLVAVSIGCTGNIGGSDAAPPPDAPKDVVGAPKTVPAALELTASEGYCVPLAAGERLASVSPEGHAWLVTPAASASALRVLDPFSADDIREESVAIGGLETVQALSAADASAIAADALWRLDDFARIELTPPAGFVAPGAMCGDLGVNGFLLSAGQVFERRDDNLWWQWDSGAAGDAAPGGIVRFEGECQSATDRMWLTSPDGTLWRVEPTTVVQPIRFPEMVAIAAAGEMLAVLEGDRLSIGPDVWQPWVFTGEAPSHLSASGTEVWMATGAAVLRFDGEQFVEVGHELDEPITGIAAHAGGAWITGATTICHLATERMLRVEGLRPFTRSKELEYAVRVRADDTDATLGASLDGEPLTLTADEEPGWASINVHLEGLGWHTLVLTADGSSGDGRRSIAVKRLPEVTRSWATDMQPIYAQHCTAVACHGGTGDTDAPDLATRDAWAARAAEIRTRVIDAETMPPPASRRSDWGDDEIETISEWLEGGMLP